MDINDEKNPEWRHGCVARNEPRLDDKQRCELAKRNSPEWGAWLQDEKLRQYLSETDLD